MYCDPATVRNLSVNIKSGISDDEIAAAARFVEAVIDARLAEHFYWPNDSNGDPIDPIPPLIVELANLSVSARLESRFYAQNEAQGYTANPYGRRLQAEADEALDMIVNGDMDTILGLERAVEIRSSTPAQSFTTPNATRGSRPFSDRR